MGCSKGSVYVFDPKLMKEGQLKKYSSDLNKNRRVEQVRWFEPRDDIDNVNKFLVVFDDGMIYVFYSN